MVISNSGYVHTATGRIFDRMYLGVPFTRKPDLNGNGKFRRALSLNVPCELSKILNDPV